jgi:cyclophilin family peptidyl-prolyl cis-trans isomerase/protein-disulfide isomerase
MCGHACVGGRLKAGPRAWLVGAFLALALLVVGCTPAATTLAPTPTLRRLPTLAPTALPKTMTCIVVSAQPTSGPTEASLFPGPAKDDNTQGPADGAVTFLEYTDLQSPASAALDKVLAALEKKYPQDVQRVFRHFPLPANDKSMLAAAAAEAARQQGKFWEMSAAILSGQSQWNNLDSQNFQTWLDGQAAALGLDGAQFKKDLRDPAIKTRLDQAQRFGLENGIPTMPFLLVNGSIYQGPRDLRSLESLVNLLRMQARQFTECPPFVIDPQREYTAEIDTNKGKIVLQLFPKEAPLAVNNFVFLARSGWYNGVTFHRVIDDTLAQSGDPSGTGFGSPGYAFPDEISTLRFDRPGVLAMANVGADSNGSQFFITYRAIPELDGKYTIFGQVLEGMETLAALTRRDPAQAGDLPEGDTIQTITITEK